MKMKKTRLTLDEIVDYIKEDNDLYSNFYSDDEIEVIPAILELKYGYGKRIKSKKCTKYTRKDIIKAIEEKDNVLWYQNMEAYHDSLDDLVNTLDFDTLERYFDYDAYYKDCEYDVSEASNGVVLQDY